MPQDFSASVLPVLPMYIDKAFDNLGYTQPHLGITPNTVKGILERQSVKIEPIKDQAGNLCVGAKIWYFVTDDATIPTASATPIASTCLIGAGETLSTDSQDYDLNLFQKTVIEINTKDCDNAAKFAMKVGNKFAETMHKMALSLNNSAIAAVEANKSTPVAGNLQDGVTIGGGGEYTITGSDYWVGIGASKIMPTLDQLALVKGLTGNYYVLTGKALQIPIVLAKDAQLNQNERSYVVTFTGRHEFVSDPQSLDTIIGADVIYLIDPSVIFGYSANYFPTKPTPANDTNNTQMFSLPLEYYDAYQNGGMSKSALMYKTEMGMNPVMLDVRQQIVCNVDGQYGTVSYDHKYELSLSFLLGLAPRLAATNTGIIRIDRA